MYDKWCHPCKIMKVINVRKLSNKKGNTKGKGIGLAGLGLFIVCWFGVLFFSGCLWVHLFEGEAKEERLLYRVWYGRD